MSLPAEAFHTVEPQASLSETLPCRKPRPWCPHPPTGHYLDLCEVSLQPVPLRLIGPSCTQLSLTNMAPGPPGVMRTASLCLQTPSLLPSPPCIPLLCSSLPLPFPSLHHRPPFLSLLLICFSSPPAFPLGQSSLTMSAAG